MESGEGKRMSLKSCEVLDDLLRFDPYFYNKIICILGVLGPTYDDIISGFVLYTFGLYRQIGLDAFGLALRLFSNFETTATLSSMLKALGANSCRLGAMLCEVQTLQGRGVGTLDLFSEAQYRCSADDVARRVIHIDQSLLARMVKLILNRELPRQNVEFADNNEFWSRRWLWCVNGAHNRILERHDSRYMLGEHLPKRVHRRVFMEHCTYNPLEIWDGITLYTASEKLEHGKRRAIFSCDSATYVNFEHILRPIELK